jgi:predicted DNA-binding protein
MATKLTITLPDELSRRAKARAALEGTTLSAVVRKHLEEFAAGLDLLEAAEDLRVVEGLEARIQRGEEPIHAWEDVKAELSAIPDHGN